MSDNTLLLGTRKGLIVLKRNGDAWNVDREAFLGVAVSYAAQDPRTGTLWACLDTDHWGPKLQRSGDGGDTWEDIPLPTYPEGAETGDGQPAVLSYIWTIAPGGDDQPQRLYLGTEPGGLFVSDDGGDTLGITPRGRGVGLAAAAIIRAFVPSSSIPATAGGSWPGSASAASLRPPMMVGPGRHVTRD